MFIKNTLAPTLAFVSPRVKIEVSSPHVLSPNRDQTTRHHVSFMSSSEVSSITEISSCAKIKDMEMQIILSKISVLPLVRGYWS